MVQRQHARQRLPPLGSAPGPLFLAVFARGNQSRWSYRLGMILQRVTYGLVAITVLILLFLADIVVAEWADVLDSPLGQLLSHGSVLPVVFTAVVFCAGIEMTRLFRATGARPHAVFSQLMIAALMLTPWLSAGGWLGSDPIEVEGMYWQVVWLMVTVVGACVLSVFRGRPEGTLRDLGATFIMVFYLGFLTSFSLQLRCGVDIPGQQGAWLLMIALLIIKATDMGGFLAGSVFGRHRLLPAVSPSKTIEGTIGGMLASVSVALAIVSAPSWAEGFGVSESGRLFIEEITGSLTIANSDGGLSPMWRAALIGLILSISSQLGDLIESCFKRDARIKDSGTMIPRSGGILDMIDSPILGSPVAWFLLTVVWNVA